MRLSPDGNAACVPVYLSVQNVVLDGVECHCLIVTDLSAQKRYEEIVAVMEAVPVGVFIAQDAECRRMIGNRMAYELLRVPPARMSRSPRPVREMPQDRGARSETAETFRPGNCRCRRPRAPASPCMTTSLIWCSTMALRDAGSATPYLYSMKRGSSRGAVGAFVDITDRKRAGEALEATNANFGSFAYALAHGLQEPLRIWWWNSRAATGRGDATGMLGARCGQTSLRFRLRRVKNGGHPEGTVALLGGYGAERRGLIHRSTAIACWPRRCSIFSRRFEQSRAIVTSDPLPTVVADEIMVEQVFRNLIGNSVKYRGKAAPKIHISAVRAGERWLFSVRDNGIGIARADAERVFDVFGRLDGDGIPGTGLGLALCRKVVERHGGRIWVESETGKGASFRFTIPIYLDTALPGFSTASGSQ